jgi:hypothetical protein
MRTASFQMDANASLQEPRLPAAYFHQNPAARNEMAEFA